MNGAVQPAALAAGREASQHRSGPPRMAEPISGPSHDWDDRVAVHTPVEFEFAFNPPLHCVEDDDEVSACKVLSFLTKR